MKKKKRILVIDDEKTILLSLSYALQDKNVEVVTCNRAEWAYKALQNHHFDLVITDLRLSETGDYSGLQILEMAKKLQPSCRVIMITSHGSEAIRKEAWRMGANGFFEKPIQINALLEEMKKMGIAIKKEKAESKECCAQL